MNDLFIKMTQMLWDGLFDEFKVLLREHPESLCAEMVLSAVKYNYMNNEDEQEAIRMVMRAGGWRHLDEVTSEMSTEMGARALMIDCEVVSREMCTDKYPVLFVECLECGNEIHSLHNLLYMLKNEQELQQIEGVSRWLDANSSRIDAFERRYYLFEALDREEVVERIGRDLLRATIHFSHLNTILISGF